MLLAQVVFNLFCVHPVETAEVIRVDVFRDLAFFERVGLHLVCWHCLVLEFYLIVSGWLIDIDSQPHDGLEDVQLLLLVQQFTFLNLVLGRFVVGEEIFLVDGCEVRVIEVVGYLLLIDDLFALLLYELVVLQFLRIVEWRFGALVCWVGLFLFHVIRDYIVITSSDYYSIILK